MSCSEYVKCASLDGDAGYVAPLYASRAEVPEMDRWCLEDIYATPDMWESDAKVADELTAKLASLKGHVMDSASTLLEIITLDENIGLVLGKLYSYAHMRSHEDAAAEEPKARASRATRLSVQISEATAFIVPEILAGSDKIEGYLSQEPKLGLYRLMLSRIVREKSHVLSSEQEAIMAAMGELSCAPDEIFSMLTNADMVFGEITDENGAKQKLTQESYGRYVMSKDRRVRREAFDGLHKVFSKFSNTLGATYAASVKKDVTFSRLRKYSSALEASLFGNEIPVSVYDGLVTAVNENLPALHEYVRMKKRALGVDHMEPYDLYAPIAKAIDGSYSYNTAKSIVLDAVKPLGDEYCAIMKKAFDSRWIDVYENKGKRSGAYSWGCFGVHPYMLLNYGGTFRDVSTLAHEGGHSMHTWLSSSNQPQAYADYTIFVAEVASTVNEMLLIEHFLSRTSKKDERIFLLNEQVELIRQTIYRQTLFAEFERDVHAKAERGEPLTPEVMNRLWTSLNCRYYGDEVGKNVLLAAEWSRIPHFYTAFYVYQYATSLSAAVTLVERILHGGIAERDAYLGLLKGGCSKDPISLLRDAGVDMSTPEPVEKALAVFARKTKELESLLF